MLILTSPKLVSLFIYFFILFSILPYSFLNFNHFFILGSTFLSLISSHLDK